MNRISGVGNITARKIQNALDIDYVEELVNFTEIEIMQLTNFSRRKTLKIVNATKELLRMWNKKGIYSKWETQLKKIYALKKIYSTEIVSVWGTTRPQGQ